MLLKIQGIVKKNKYESQKNQDHKRLTWTQINPQYSGFFRLYQFLLAIYLRFQQNSNSTYFNAKKNFTTREVNSKTIKGWWQWG